MSLILGIDPGSVKTGFGIIDYDCGRSKYVTSGVIRLPDDELPARLRVIYDSITELVELHCPQELAIEQVFMARSAGSALKLGQARGAAIVAASAPVSVPVQRGHGGGAAVLPSPAPVIRTGRGQAEPNAGAKRRSRPVRLLPISTSCLSNKQVDRK